MAHLSPIEKRDILHSKNLSDDEARRHAEMFLADGLSFDALAFFAKIKDKTGIKKIIDLSLEEGDSFLFLMAFKYLAETPPPDLLRRVGEKAFSLEKYFYAYRAFQHLGDQALIEKVKPFIPVVEEIHMPVGAETEV